MSENRIVDKNSRAAANKTWPENCIWPEPLWNGEGDFWEEDLVCGLDADDVIDELLEIKEYMDHLVEEGRLNEDYSLNEDYEPDEDFWDDEKCDQDTQEEDISDADAWEPEKGIDYWDDGFDLFAWEEDLTFHMNCLKIPAQEASHDPVQYIRCVIDYNFINENLMRQAFTRRAFGIEYGVGDSEQLEFIGDTILQTVVTREIARQFTDVDVIKPQAPFQNKYDEGEMTRLRKHFVSGEHLAARAKELDLDQFILYGTGECASDSACEDMMEALIGAVAVDCSWNWTVLENVVDRLVCVQVIRPDELLKASYYDLFNAWHQRRFGVIPTYEVSGPESIRNREPYRCAIRFQIPENDQSLALLQRIDVSAATRSKARDYAANRAYSFVRAHRLWVNLTDSGITPDLENSINQLQELYQKKYLDNPPEYSFTESPDGAWCCDCVCSGIAGFGRASGKTKAKKQAAFMVLERLFGAAGK